MKKRSSLVMEADTHQRLRLLAAWRNQTMAEALDDAIHYFFKVEKGKALIQFGEKGGEQGT